MCLDYKYLYLIVLLKKYMSTKNDFELGRGNRKG